MYIAKTLHLGIFFSDKLGGFGRIHLHRGTEKFVLLRVLGVVLVFMLETSLKEFIFPFGP